MNKIRIKEFIISCLRDCDMTLKDFKENGFIELSRLHNENWSFFVCFLVDERIKVGGHYPLLNSTGSDINDVLSFIYDHNIKLITKSDFANNHDLSICGKLFYDFIYIDIYQKKLDIERLCEKTDAFYLKEISNRITIEESFGSFYGSGICINIPTPDGNECIYGVKDEDGFHFRVLIKTYSMQMLDYIFNIKNKK